ncbi:sugar phosphate isomerase/epimerase family protein [Schlesneria sp.]|uniref:sugar phosphate isomerase/epimerase family protein n=1 Tax=Schlesneria sp. TaxID=2762018 RepID=UPI002F0B910A
MLETLDRRDFLNLAGIAAATGLLSMTSRVAEAADEKLVLRKAVKLSMVGGKGTLVEKFKMAKAAGFEGIDVDQDQPVEEVKKAMHESGLIVHGMVDYVHWGQPLSSADPAVRAKGVEVLQKCLRETKIYGGDTVLLVPAVVNKEVSYEDAYHRSQAEIKKCLPLATELGVKILFENVWNNFLLSPVEMARYIDEFQSPMVGSYFDVGNIVNIGWPEHWIATLGPRIGKLDIKEFSRKLADTKGKGAGFGVEIGEGDCDWPAVLAALKKIKYSGWATAEVPGGGLERLTEIAQRMDQHIIQPYSA